MRPFDDAAQILFGKSADQLDETEREVLLHSREGRILSEDRNVAYEARQSLGDRVADAIARVGGSWTFIIGFLLFLVVWTLAKAGNGYKVTNLTDSGVALAVTQGADFDSYIQRNGFDGLVAFMKKRG